MKQIWLRIFIYTVVLLVLMQTASFFLHRYTVGKNEPYRYIADNLRYTAAALEGESSSVARAAASLFGRRGGRIWVITTMRDGKEVALVGNMNFDPGKIKNDPEKTRWSDGDLRIWSAQEQKGRFIASLPVKLSDADAMLYISYSPGRGPEFWNFFMQGVIGFSIVGCILAFWLARSVSRPLRRMRGEVLEIAGGKLDKRVEAKGPDEVKDVALAVNHMADSLSKYISNMRELVANISHELRSPLARMQVSLALLEEKLAGENDGKTLSQLRLLEEEMEHMNKLIGTTLLSSKLDLHAGQPVSAQVAFSELVHEMLRRQAQLIQKRSLELRADIQDNVEIRGDETLLCNLVSNYLDNAVKYAREQGAVKVRLFTAQGKAVLEVENTHPPIAPEVLDKLFEPFYRGGVATGGGVGLGLHLVRQIAAKHGGTAGAENTEGGVLFRVSLPL